jgi:RNA-directed DNA polymerase
VVQGALKLIVEPIFEADFQPGSFGYRPKRTAHQAVTRVAEAISRWQTRVIDVDLKAYFDGVRHDVLLAKVAKRINDDDVLHLLKLILKASGKQGVSQGGVISPVLSNLYLNEVDQMLERAKERTRSGEYVNLDYARFADDIVILIDAHPRHDWLLKAVDQRLREKLAKLRVQINEEESRVVDLARGESFGYLGFDFRRIKSRLGNWRPQFTPKLKKRTALLQKLREIFRRSRSQPLKLLVDTINPILRGWLNYFAIGHSSRCFGFLRDWVEKKIRRHLMRARKRRGYGWERWTSQWLYAKLGLFNGYQLRTDLRYASSKAKSHNPRHEANR